MEQMRDQVAERNARADAKPRACSAVLAMRQRCDLTEGHGGRHNWVDIHRDHVHGAWCHPSADGCPDRPGM
jgi:hypothetical protein